MFVIVGLSSRPEVDIKLFSEVSVFITNSKTVHPLTHTVQLGGLMFSYIGEESLTIREKQAFPVQFSINITRFTAIGWTKCVDGLIGQGFLK